MNARTIRRAAERQAAKLARKAQPTVATTNPTAITGPAVVAAPISPAKLAANQANAQLSCGPKSDAGKLIASKNALKTGLTGRTVLLPTDDAAAYQTLLDRFLADCKPATPEETTLVQSIIDTTWRLERIANLEFGIYAIGSLEFAEQFEDLEPAARNQMVQVETYLKYEKSIRNLNVQEARLHRRLAKETAELKRIQSERLQQEADVKAFLAARNLKEPAQPPSNEVGFVFSNGQIPGETIPSVEPIATLDAVAGG